MVTKTKITVTYKKYLHHMSGLISTFVDYCHLKVVENNCGKSSCYFHCASNFVLLD